MHIKICVKKYKNLEKFSIHYQKCFWILLNKLKKFIDNYITNVIILRRLMFKTLISRLDKKKCRNFTSKDW